MVPTAFLVVLRRLRSRKPSRLANESDTAVPIRSEDAFLRMLPLSMLLKRFPDFKVPVAMRATFHLRALRGGRI